MIERSGHFWLGASSRITKIQPDCSFKQPFHLLNVTSISCFIFCWDRKHEGTLSSSSLHLCSSHCSSANSGLNVMFKNYTVVSTKQYSWLEKNKVVTDFPSQSGDLNRQTSKLNKSALTHYCETILIDIQYTWGPRYFAAGSVKQHSNTKPAHHRSTFTPLQQPCVTLWFKRL